MDFGDAPASYPTLFADDGARHGDVGVFLGAAVDVSEPDGLPTTDALGDDNTDTDDEDGVTFTSSITVGTTVSVSVSVNGPASPMNAWLDFNGDGDWNDPGEQIFTDEVIAPGLNNLSFGVPADATTGSSYARFRVDSGGGLTPSGFSPDGEVEDYLVTIIGVPSAPTGVTGTPGNTQVAVSWTAPASDRRHADHGVHRDGVTGRRHLHHHHNRMHRHRTHQRHPLHLHHHRHQRHRNQPPIHTITNHHAIHGPVGTDRRHRHTRQHPSRRVVDRSRVHRRLTDHRLHRNRITRRRDMRDDGCDRMHGDRFGERNPLHVHSHRDQRDRHRPSIVTISASHSGGADDPGRGVVGSGSFARHPPDG